MFFARKKKEGKVLEAKKEGSKRGKGGTSLAARKKGGRGGAAPRGSGEKAGSREVPSKERQRELLREGWLRIIIIFEIAGKPREHVERTLRAYLENVKNDRRVLVLEEEFADALEHEDGIFSAFVEAEMLVQGFETLTWLAINFMPASIEVVEPEQVLLPANKITAWSNDLLAKLHETSTLLREERAVVQNLTRSLNALIKNAVLIAAKSERSAGELAVETGISEEQLAPFLRHLVEKGRLVKKGEKYVVV